MRCNGCCFLATLMEEPASVLCTNSNVLCVVCAKYTIVQLCVENKHILFFKIKETDSNLRKYTQ